VSGREGDLSNTEYTCIVAVGDIFVSARLEASGVIKLSLKLGQKERKLSKSGKAKLPLITLLNSLTLIFSSSSCSFQDSESVRVRRNGHGRNGIGGFGAGLQPFYLAWDFTVPGDRPASEREKKEKLVIR